MLHLGQGSLWCWNFDTLEDQKYLESFEMCCWRRMEKTSWTKHVKNDIFLRIKEEKNILHTIKWRKANWNGHILHRNCILKHVIQGKIEEQGRWGGRCKQLLDDLTEMRRYWTLKEEACDSSLWRTRFEGRYGPLVEDRWWCCWW